jgi:DNA-binding SARP family transcriptional activator
MLAGTLRVVGGVLRGLIAATVLLALVAGLPWALWRYIGWPLPDHVPTGDEVAAVLLSPMTTTFLLDVLACLCWITWIAFVIDVARCTVDAMRGARWPQVHSGGGPVHTVAAVLIGAIVVTLAGNRSLAHTSPRPSPTVPTATPAVATAWHLDSPAEGAEFRLASQPVPVRAAASRVSSMDIEAMAATAVVREPRNGVYDSMWRIAHRELGDGARWPEIFALNKGKPQPNGGQLTNPNLIFPGEELRLPTAHPTEPPPAGEQPQPSPAPPPPSSPTPAPPTTTPAAPIAPTREQEPPVTPAPTAAHQPGTDIDRPSPGVGWGVEVFVGFGLAAAISAALLLARRRHHRAYRPGSGRRDDLPVAPVVSRLRLAHLRATAEPDDGQDHSAITTPPTVIIGPSQQPEPTPPHVRPELGVRDGREIALDLAIARGLGLVGPGASAAARALLVALLTRTSRQPNPPPSAVVLVPADDLATLVGAHATGDIPAALRVAADLDTALDELDTEIQARIRHEPAADEPPSLVVVASPPDGTSSRLQAVLDNGAPFGIVGVLLGQWRSGITAHVHADGTVSATNPGVGEALEGTQLYRLPDTDTRDLLRLLRHAQSDTPLPPAEPGSDPVPTELAPVTDVLAPDPRQPSTTRTPPDSIDTSLEITRSHPLPGALVTETINPPPPAAPRAPTYGPVKQERPGDLPGTPITVTVLGPLQIHWRPDSSEPSSVPLDITAALPPRQRELLVFLALHPNGVHRDAVAATLWADNPPDRPTNALNTALSRLRAAMSTATAGALSDLTVSREGRYQLNPAVVDVDYWPFAAAVAARRAATSDPERIAALRRVVDGYTGRLAEGMDTEWIDTVREATARDAIDAVAALARAMVDTDPEYTLNLLETARAFDPHNELLYRDIMRLQERLGRLDAIPRTLTLLTTRLAEIDEKPSADALRLATRLQHRPDPPAPTAGRRPNRGDHRGSAAAS